MEKITTYTKSMDLMFKKNKDNKEDFLTLFIFTSNLFNLESAAAFIWCGTKAKMKSELNEIFDFLDCEKRLKTQTGYDTWVDVFGGALNSTLVLMESLIVSGVKNFIINDISNCITQTHRDIKDNPNELIKEFSEIIRKKFIIRNGTLFLNKKDFENIIKELGEELRKFEINKDYSVRSSIRFILLRDLAFSGIINFRKDGTFKFSEKIFAGSKVFPWLFKQVTRINKFSKIYNELNIQIYNLDCFELLQLNVIKNNPNALINLDPPYIEQMKKKETEYINQLEDLKLSNNLNFKTIKEVSFEKLKDCTIDYNQKFPHIDLIESLNSFNFIYNNNSHIVIDYSNEIINAHKKDFDRKENMANKKNEKAKIVKEIILFKNSLN